MAPQLQLLALLLLCSSSLYYIDHASSSSPPPPPPLPPPPGFLPKYVDKLPTMPSIKGYYSINGTFLPATITIGMYQTKWKFHRDIPPTTVYAFGRSATSATVPGPTIQALSEIHTYVRWENHLPARHMFTVDNTLDIANPPNGIPTVVHVHGSLSEPESDGYTLSWFTAEFQNKGPTWNKEVYHYHNAKGHSNLWYHDHALGVTRLNILAGLIGAYVIRNPYQEASLQLPVGSKYDRHLVIFDRSFNRDGSIYRDPMGNNPTIHPQWQPEYFGNVIIVNGKAWPFLNVQRRKYRFRIINSSNARFFRFALDNGLSFTQIGSDAFYLQIPVVVKEILLAPSEIADVIIDFKNSPTSEILLTNSAEYPFPQGDPVNDMNGNVMKFILDKKVQKDPSRIPMSLVPFHRLEKRDAIITRYISLYEFVSNTGQPNQLVVNFLPFEAPVTETPKQGTTELWYIINLTGDNHPIHVHLVGSQYESQFQLNDTNRLGECLKNLRNAEKCNLLQHVTGMQQRPQPTETGWKNVFKTQPGYLTGILLQFSQIDFNPFPFNASAEPGYVYHCHMLEHEDNVMIRPFKILP